MVHTASALLGGIPVDIEYEYEPAERQTFDHPGCPAAVSVLVVRVGDNEVDDVENVFSESQIDRWEREILEGAEERARTARDIAADAAWQWAFDNRLRVA